MAVINQIKLSSNNTTYDVNDKRITSTAASTANYVMTANSNVTSIAPMSVADATSLLGGVSFTSATGSTAISKGYGILILYASSLGKAALFLCEATSVYPLGGSTEKFTVTKSSEYVTDVSTTNGSYQFYYCFIGK